MGPTFNPHPNLPPTGGRDFISSPSRGRTKVGVTLRVGKDLFSEQSPMPLETGTTKYENGAYFQPPS